MKSVLQINKIQAWPKLVQEIPVKFGSEMAETGDENLSGTGNFWGSRYSPKF
jgi:hypothetical protein